MSEQIMSGELRFQKEYAELKEKTARGVRTELAGKTREQVIDMLCGMVGYFRGVEGLDVDGLQSELWAIRADDDDEFVAKVMKVLEPVLKVKASGDTVFQERERAYFTESNRFTPLNDVLSYGFEGGTVHIHIAPSKGKAGLMTSVREGLEKLAGLLKTEMKDVSEVSATSWIVAAHPHLLERFGFTVEGEQAVSDEMRRAHFGDDPRPIARAVMRREDFLARYGRARA